MKGKFVLVRSYSAGVHFGTLESEPGKEVTLTNARRLWRWRGANTLSEISLKGVDHEYSRISEPVPKIFLAEVSEIIPCSDIAKENLSSSRWGK